MSSSQKQKTPNIPYMNTKINPENTQIEITLLLKKYGIKDIQWTELSGQIMLKFIHHFNIKGVEKQVAFEFKPPYIPKKVKQWNPKSFVYETIIVNHTGASMRLLFWYLESKMKAITWGLETMEMEMASHVLLSLPDGTEITLGEIIEKRMGTPALEGLNRLALEEKDLVTEK